MKRLIFIILFLFSINVNTDPGGPQDDGDAPPANEPAIPYNSDGCFITSII